MATRTRKQESAAATATAPEVVDIAEAVAREEIEKAARKYVDVTPRFPSPEGTLVSVQRERRGDESLGEYLLAEIRKSKQKGQPDSVTRHPIARIQMLADVLGASGVRVLRDVKVSK